MFIIQSKIVLNFHMHWLVSLLYPTRIRAKATLEILTGHTIMQLPTSLRMFYYLTEHLKKISLYPPCGASVALFVMMCYHYQSYLASLWTSSLLLMPPVGLKSTLKHLSN